MKKIFTYLALAAAFALSAAAVEIKCGGFSPDKIRPGQTAKYSIVLEGLSGSIDQSAIPLPQGLRVVGTSRSQNFSMTNGRTSRQTRLIFIVQAEREGEFTVPEWSIEYDSKKYKIDAAKLSVDKNAPVGAQGGFFGGDDEDDAFGFPSIVRRMHNSQRAQMRQMQRAQQDAQSALGSLSEHISLKLNLPKEKIYVGEAVPCKLEFSYSRELAAAGFKLARLIPQANKSDAFDCLIFDEKPATKTGADGKITVSYDIVITPLKAGLYNLDFAAKGIFLQEYRIDSFFSMPFGGTNQVPFETSTADRKIGVSDLPAENKPACFSGAIGKFSMSEAKAEPDSLSEGEPTVVSVNIVGVGNFARIGSPKMAASGDWKTYKPKSSFTDESNGMGYVGFKNFKFTAVPKKADIAATPTIEFAYFDPETGAYKTLSSKGAPVSVAPSGSAKPRAQSAEGAKSGGAAGEKSPKDDIIIPPAPPSGNGSLLGNPAFWAIQACIVALAALFVAARARKLKIQNDPAFAKKLRCSKQAAKMLKKAEAAAAAGDVENFLECAKKTLQNIAAANSAEYESEAILENQAREIMDEAGCGAENAQTAHAIFAGADAIEYGGVDKNSIDCAKLLRELSKIYSRLK